MNRAQRRAKLREQRAQVQAATTAVHKSGRIPVFSSDGHIEDTIERTQLERYRRAPNASVVVDEATGEQRVILAVHSDDAQMRGRRGNPLRYSHDSETEQNPAQVWTLKRLARRDRDIYRSSVLDCIAPERKKVVELDAAIAKESRRRRANVRAIDALRAERKSVVTPLVARLKQVYAEAA